MTAACRLRECAAAVPTAGALLTTLPSIPQAPLCQVCAAHRTRLLFFPATLRVPATSDLDNARHGEQRWRLKPTSPPYQMIYLK
ncbi:TPA: hypothetical protein JAJ28_003721 [Aeromonas hydrophila]|uniref:Uncharacterized protein n=1 Tax=Aeromonas hydrophila TaxID=644 RepID=A0AAD3UDL7_AERHY|nr:hypothetical protein [Aeromonas hydrophila]